MNKRCAVLAVVCAGLIGMGAVSTWAAEREGGEVKVTIDQVPAAVKATILAEGGKIHDIARKSRNGSPFYEADVIKNGKEIELQVAEDGKLFSRKIEGDVKEEGQAAKPVKASEAQTEAKACVEAAKTLARAKITMLQALESAMKEGKGAKPYRAELRTTSGRLVFSIRLLDGETRVDMDIDAMGGKVLKTGRSVELKKSGAKASGEAGRQEQKPVGGRLAVIQAMPLAKVTLAEAVETAVAQASRGKVYMAEFKPEDGKPSYEVQVVAGDQCVEVVIDGVDRKVIETEPKGSTKPMTRPAAKDAGWRNSFAVNKANLVPTGKNPYFSLEPGYQAKYKDGKDTLVITVLNETKVVDGVTTRIVEEREEASGKLAEVSRNFFAMDKTTDDVYYFGEEVDDYKDGKLVGHGGAWLAGVKGARFGLIMPGKPKVGDKYYQEIAPRVAMDRAEIVSLEKELETPAGKFKCLYVEETSPIEKGTSRKWYAAGVGMVKDDGFVLESVKRP